MRHSPSSRRTRSLLTAAVLVAALVATACGGSDDDGAGSQEVVVATQEGFVQDLLPGNADSTYVTYALFTPLTVADRSGGVRNAVAESVESEDQKVWTITIADGWTFHDGSAVTAQSFADSWNLTALGSNALSGNALMSVIEGYDAMNPESGEPTAQTLSGVEVVDDSTLRVTLVEPDRFFPYTLSISTFAPVPEGTEDLKAFATAPIGNGPFKAPDGGWSAGDQDITLERFDDYGGEPAKTERVTLRPYQSSDSFYTDFQAGDLDVAVLEGTQLTSAQDELPDQVVDVEQPALLYLGFPLDEERFADVNLRRAISLGIDREAIVESLADGHGSPATSIAPDLMEGSDLVECTACTYDPDAARQALAEAGGLDGELSLVTYADPLNERVLQGMANELSEVLGSEVGFTTQPINQLYESLAAGSVDSPFLLYAGAGYPHVMASARLLLRTGALLNVTGFSDPEMDRALDVAAAEPDAAVATQQTAAAITGALDQLPIIPIYHPDAGIVHDESVGGVGPEALGGVRLVDLTVE